MSVGRPFTHFPKKWHSSHALIAVMTSAWTLPFTEKIHVWLLTTYLPLTSRKNLLTKHEERNVSPRAFWHCIVLNVFKNVLHWNIKVHQLPSNHFGALEAHRPKQIHGVENGPGNLYTAALTLSKFLVIKGYLAEKNGFRIKNQYCFWHSRCTFPYKDTATTNFYIFLMHGNV